MRFLLDTHTLLWYISGDQTLPKAVVNAISDLSNQCYVSVASIWEITIKMSNGKLEVRGGLPTIEDFLINNDFELTPITFEDNYQLAALSFYHRDPFDRMLIAQARRLRTKIITKDELFHSYPVSVYWPV